MTLAQVQWIVGRPPDISGVPDGIVLDQEVLFVPAPFKEEAATASWRDNDKRLEIYYCFDHPQHVLAKKFYCPPPRFSDKDFWQRLAKWLHGTLNC